MSCNGCRVLRKGCSEGCALRPCLEWIESAEAQGFATLFLAKFFGRAGLMEFITAVPLSQRPALFQSLLYEACGRTVNPVYGAVGLLYSGKWHLCQEAVETILNGGNLHTNNVCNHNDNTTHKFSIINPTSRSNVPCLEGSQAIIPSRPSHSDLFKGSSIFLHTKLDQRSNITCKPSISTSGFHSLEENISFNNAHKKRKMSSENLESRSLIFQARPRQGVLASCNYVTNTRHHRNMVTSRSHTMIQHSESQSCTLLRPDFENPFNVANGEVYLALTLRSNDQGGASKECKEGISSGRVSSPSEGSIITSLRSPLLPSTSCHHLEISPSSKSHQNKKLLNLLI